EAHTDATSAAGVPVKLAVTLPAGELAGFLAAACVAVEAAAPGARCILFGHAGDGNVHVNVLGAWEPHQPPATQERRAAAVEDAVLRLVARLGGSISAEHGLGTAKRPWLPLHRRPTDNDTLRALQAPLR